MNYRQKSKRFGKWSFVKYQGNMAIYAYCENCGYAYPCCTTNINNNSFKVDPSLSQLHKYCPNCGLKMKPLNGTHVYKVDYDILGNKLY